VAFLVGGRFELSKQRGWFLHDFCPALKKKLLVEVLEMPLRATTAMEYLLKYEISVL
jgi:hypothetical protein